MTLLSGTLLGILQNAGEDILILTEGVDPEEFFASNITQREVIRQLRIMTETVGNLSDKLKQDMIEIDWGGWTVLSAQLMMSSGFDRDAVWFAIRSLVPATLLWLRVYRQNSPKLFSIIP